MAQGRIRQWNRLDLLTLDGRHEKGEKVGRWREWREDRGSGTPSSGPLSEGDYEQGQRTGRWQFRYENGQVWAEGDYRSGKKQSRWRYGRSDGSLASQAEYEDGALQGKECWSRAREPVDCRLVPELGWSVEDLGTWVHRLARNDGALGPPPRE